MDAQHLIDALLAIPDPDFFSFVGDHLEDLRNPELSIALRRRAKMLHGRDSEKAERVARLLEELQHATPIDYDSLPPYRLYRAVARDEYSIKQAIDQWTQHLQEGSWPEEWLLHLNAKIVQLAQTSPLSPKLVHWATIQVGAARQTGDADLLAQVLTTAGGVLAVTGDTDKALFYHVEAIQTALVGSRANLSNVTSVAGQNFAREFAALEGPLPEAVAALGITVSNALAEALSHLKDSNSENLIYTQCLKVLTKLAQSSPGSNFDNHIASSIKQLPSPNASDELFYWVSTLAESLRERHGPSQISDKLLEQAYRIAENLGIPEHPATASYNLEQKSAEIFAVFGKRVTGEMTDDQFEQELRMLRANGILDEDVVITLDNSLIQIDERSPDLATRYRAMSLNAARIVGIPHLIANAAYSAYKTAWLIDQNIRLAIDYAVESLEAYAQAPHTPPESLARSFRNLARMFHLVTTNDLNQIETAFQRILAVAEGLEARGVDPISRAACIDPLIESFSYLTSIGLSRAYFSRLHQLAM